MTENYYSPSLSDFDFLTTPVPLSARLSFDFRAGAVLCDGSPRTISKSDTELLIHFVQNAGKIVTGQDIWKEVYHSTTALQKTTIQSAVDRLRSTLGRLDPLDPYAGSAIESIPGVGYRLNTYQLNKTSTYSQFGHLRLAPKFLEPGDASTDDAAEIRSAFYAPIDLFPEHEKYSIYNMGSFNLRVNNGASRRAITGYEITSKVLYGRSSFGLSHRETIILLELRLADQFRRTRQELQMTKESDKQFLAITRKLAGQLHAIVRADVIQFVDGHYELVNKNLPSIVTAPSPPSSRSMTATELTQRPSA